MHLEKLNFHNFLVQARYIYILDENTIVRRFCIQSTPLIDFLLPGGVPSTNTEKRWESEDRSVSSRGCRYSHVSPSC